MTAPSPFQIGQRFGRLTIKKRLPNNRLGNVVVLCGCDCGNETRPTLKALRRGDVKSCGCLRRDAASARARKRLHVDARDLCDDDIL